MRNHEPVDVNVWDHLNVLYAHGISHLLGYKQIKAMRSRFDHEKDEDYALFYRDVSEEPKKYDGKTVSFKGQVAMLRRDKNGMFAPGRFVMTCCVEDIQFCGIPCRYDQAGTLEPRSWVMVTAKITAEKHPLYKGEVGPVLTALEVTKNAQPADPDVATF